jgi:putative ABC transport system permease protein
VTAGEFGFDESVLERVQAISQVGVAQPVIESTAEFAGGTRASMLILGVDMTGDRSLRDYDLRGPDASVIDDPLVFPSPTRFVDHHKGICRTQSPGCAQ